ncbi:MAG: Holliday junction branch migration DNA helicase RuvB [Lachnospirales bacterium]
MDRIITSIQLDSEEKDLELSLRPKSFDNYLGQEKVKSNMKVFIEAAKLRNEPLDHVLLYGPPGLGKTTLSNIIACELNVNIKITSGPAIEKAGDMAAILNDLQENDVLFIDEIHRLNRTIEEILYSAMEDFALDIVIGKGQAAKSLRLDLPKFTLVGATTRVGLLTTPLRDRFGVIQKLELYNIEELSSIIKRSASVLNLKIDEGASIEIARRSRGTPRIANRLLKRVRDFAEVLYNGDISVDVAQETLDRLEVDSLGLDGNDRLLLQNIIEKFDGGPVGLETLAVSLGEDKDTIEDVYEPYLIQLGFINRTKSGRIATKKCYEHLGLKYLKGEAFDNLSLF